MPFSLVARKARQTSQGLPVNFERAIPKVARTQRKERRGEERRGESRKERRKSRVELSGTKIEARFPDPPFDSFERY